MSSVFVLVCTASSYFPGAQQMLDMVNQARQAAGVKPVCASAKLMASAMKQAQYQASQNRMTHDGPTPLPQRFTEQGFTPLTMAENAAQTPGMDIPAVESALMADPAHKANIVGATYTHFGAGVAKGSDGQYYWAQHFAQGGGSEPCATDLGAGGAGPSAPGVPGSMPGTAPGGTPGASASLPGMPLPGMPGAAPGSPMGGMPSVPSMPGAPAPAALGMPVANSPGSTSPPPPGSPVNINAVTPPSGAQHICMQGKCYQILQTSDGIGYVPTAYNPPGLDISGGPIFA